MLQVQNLGCANAAAFIMNFTVKYQKEDGTWGSDGESGNFSVDQTRIVDCQGQGIPVGAPMRPEVHAALGNTVDGTPLVEYAPNGQTAIYEVRGTTLYFTVTLNQ